MSDWWVVDDDGHTVAGPFDSHEDAAAYDPTDDRLDAVRRDAPPNGDHQ